MKQKILAICLVFSVCCVQSQKSIEINATLTHATVYYASGAELEHSAKASLNIGSQEVLINNISPFIDINSIKVACPDNVTLVNYRFNTFTKAPEPVNDPMINKMKDSIALLQKQLTALNHDFNIQNEILQKTGLLIESNVTGEQNKNLASAELLKLIDYYNQKTKEIKTILYSIDDRKNLLSDSISHITARIFERNKMNTPAAAKLVGQLVVQVIAKNVGDADFSFSYFTKNAGWLPAYDLRVKSIDNTSKLLYKATVHQSTGLDWKQAKLSLSTSNTNLGNALPVLNPWFVSLYVPQLSNSLQEVVVIGYSAAPRSEADNQDYNLPRDKEFDKKEKFESSLVQAYTKLSESQLNLNYDIDLPYDIASDDNAVSVAIREQAISTAFKHIVTPKLDPDAFLIDYIADWQKLNLMPGEANIILDNVFTGKSFIDPNTTADTLAISLGRDKRLSVTRTLIKEFTKNRIKGDNKIEEYGYEITVKNNKITSAEIILNDQAPVSKQKDVEVNILETSAAQVNKETGMLSWNVKLQPGESKKYRFGYSVKYPADKRIASL